MNNIRRFILITMLAAVATWPSISQPRWSAVNSGITEEIRSIAFFNGSTGLAVGGGKIIRTSDGGETWGIVATRDTTRYFDIDVSAAGRATAVGLWLGFPECGRGTIQLSNDTGSSWSVISPDTSDWWGTAVPLLVTVSTPSDSTGYAVVGCDDFSCGAGVPIYVFRTTDGGLSWWDKPVAHWCIDASVYGWSWDQVDASFDSNGVGFIVGWSGLVIRTEDGADTHTIQPSGTGANLRSVDLLTGSHAVAVGDSGVIIRTTDGGANWDRIGSGTTVPLRSVRFLDEHQGIAVGDGGTILFSNDGGASWSSEESSTDFELAGVTFPDSDHAWISGAGGTVLRRNFFRSAIPPPGTRWFGSTGIDSVLTDSIPVINTGTMSVNLAYSADSPEFILFDPGRSVLPGDTGFIPILFMPSGPGNRKGTLTITHDLGGPAWEVNLGANAVQWDTSSFGVVGAWNIVSVPRRVENDSATVLFPNAVSDAYRYDKYGGYLESPRLTPGAGYWMKFPAEDTMTTIGYTIANDTTFLRAGWNLVGTITLPVPVSSIRTAPPTLLVSGFHEYRTGYHTVDTLIPGRGYWVKTASDGYLYLDAP